MKQTYIIEVAEPIVEASGKFTLSASQIHDLEKVVAKFGGDLSGLIEAVVTEKSSPEYLGMATGELEAGNHVLSVDPSVLSNLDAFIQTGIDAKDWYTEMNQKILSALGDSDGCLFLILMAIFSPQNKLAQNFRLAAQVYTGIKKDIADESKRAEFDQMLQEKNLYDAIRKEGKYKNLATIRGLVTGARNVNTFTPNLIRTLRLYKANGYKFSKQQVVQEISKHLTSKGSLGKDTVISAEKVFSFTLNLLDPNYQFENGWLPVTMDTWMASFFYPSMSKADKSKLLGKSQNYVYMAKLTQQLASKYNMKPHEMQAVIWVAMIRKKMGPKYDTTFNNAIEKNLQRLKVEITELQKAEDFFAKVIAVVGSV